MGQIGFFDLSKRYTGLDAKNEPLAKIDEVVPWEDFRGCLDAVCRRSDKARKSRAGRKPWDAVVMFKTIILSALYNLSDDQVEHQIRDRLSFMRFLGLGLEDRVPDAKTVWLYREQLTQAGGMGGQRLSLGGDRGGAEEEGVEEPDPSQSPPQQAAERAREARQQDPFVRSGPRRACFRGPEQRHGRDAAA